MKQFLLDGINLIINSKTLAKIEKTVLDQWEAQITPPKPCNEATEAVSEVSNTTETV